MARTIRVKVYKFHELSSEAKESAIHDYAQTTLLNGFAWENENRDTLEKFVDLFPVKFDRRGEGIFIYGQDEIKNLSGIRLATYLWNNYKDQLFSGKLYYKGAVSGKTKFRHSKCVLDHSCELTGYIMDEAILQPVYDHMKRPHWRMTFEDLMNDCFHEWSKAVEKDRQYQLSVEYIAEEIEVNEYEFTKDGKIYR